MKVKVIGIGTGDPSHLTIGAIDAMNEVDAFFVLDKGPHATALTEIRRALCETYIRGDYRIVTVVDPPRRRDGSSYRDDVEQWHSQRAGVLRHALTTELRDNQVAGFLVWGDPALYDSTLRIIDRLRPSMDIDLSVIPGISSVSVLTAQHQILLNRIGEPIEITTGRRLHDASGVNTVVMLDADCTFMHTARPTDEIYWGAYLGLENEVVISGTVQEVGVEIVRTRRAVRERYGWVMDIYLLRRPYGDWVA